MKKNLKEEFPWLSKIPQGSHGSKIVFKKLWKVISDYVRIRDFIAYKRCISCSKAISRWKEWQAGHYVAFSVCRGWSKYDTDNIFGQCAYCNTGYNANVTAHNFRETIKSRYGQERLDYLDSFSKKPLDKLDEYDACIRMENILKEISKLKYKPSYFTKIKSHF